MMPVREKRSGGLGEVQLRPYGLFCCFFSIKMEQLKIEGRVLYKKVLSFDAGMGKNKFAPWRDLTLFRLLLQLFVRHFVPDKKSLKQVGLKIKTHPNRWTQSLGPVNVKVNKDVEKIELF